MNRCEMVFVFKNNTEIAYTYTKKRAEYHGYEKAIVFYEDVI